MIRFDIADDQQSQRVNYINVACGQTCERWCLSLAVNTIAVACLVRMSWQESSFKKENTQIRCV